MNGLAIRDRNVATLTDDTDPLPGGYRRMTSTEAHRFLDGATMAVTIEYLSGHGYVVRR